ncbi:hypothetical protein [Litoreibacter roseus]|uniref:Uncharacterized protein n=1 Tax=Litoreibacter roseus TaxID=2601869 RepID=A0A6N6JN64_9RHOB|nr:hypothetical protein [Litoreibacter roseus]GFE66959.1 hypothetical protein KIN_40330 [Litoreibacter roseus]
MSDPTHDTSEKPSRARRAAGFLARRGGLHRAFDGARKGADFFGDLAGRLRPKPFDRFGLSGRYPDGGIARFQHMTENMSEFELGEQYRGWQLQRTWFQYAALAAVLAIPVGAVFLQISKYLIFGLVTLFLFALFRAVRADFFVWILEQGRFGGFLDYLGSRLPRNVQIILPERHRGISTDRRAGDPK